MAVVGSVLHQVEQHAAAHARCCEDRGELALGVLDPVIDEGQCLPCLIRIGRCRAGIALGGSRSAASHDTSPRLLARSADRSFLAFRRIALRIWLAARALRRLSASPRWRLPSRTEAQYSSP